MENQQKATVRQREISPKQPAYLSTLLRTKLAIPPVHPISISRARLLTQLDKWREFKVTLISAPTGFGKTTLLSEWASQSSLAVAWISLSESDNEPTRFWAYFVDALAGLSKDATCRAPESFAQDSPELIVAAIQSVIAAIPQEFVLILDDYHNVQNQQIHTALTTLLKYLPEHMHIFIVSRTRPTLPLALLRANRQLYELNPTDLLFTLEEVETFFTQTLGRELSQAQAITIKTRTDGWIAILQLVATWLQEQNDVEEALARIPGNHHYILDYLATEVLHQQPQATQLFLLQTSVLEQFNASLCDAVTGQNNARSMLEQIERVNLFIRPLDSQQSWYSYHQIFRTFLRERLELVLPDLVPILHRRACIWYEQQKRPDVAITYALAGRDFERAAEIILKIGEKMLAAGEVNTMLTWLKALPEELVCLYPLLCLFYAWGLMMVGQFDRAEMWIRNIDYLDKKASFIPEIPMRSLLEQQKSVIPYVQSESAIAVLRAHIAIFWGDISDVEDFTLQAQTSLSSANVFIQSLNTLNVGIIHWLNGNILLAEKAFSAVAVNGKRLNNTYIMLAANCGMMLTHMMRGKRRRAFAIAQQALQIIAHHKNYISPFSAYLYTEISYLLYEWNRLDEAAHYAQEALDYGAKQNLDILVYSYTILSRIALARGDLDEAQKLLQQAEDSTPYSQHRPWIVSRMAEHHVNLALAREDIRQAEYWSQLPELKPFGSLATILPMRVLLAKNQPREALGLAQMYLQDAEGGVLMLLILQAHAYWELNEMDQASQALEKALHLAEPEGYI
ncbi:MAG TPA: hypothetical protein VFN35_22785, partial [Ktedonobacteraceae bacterium]|nr:hypothetical protein [Ktedonobacteraceae bacterium]